MTTLHTELAVSSAVAMVRGREGLDVIRRVGPAMVVLLLAFLVHGALHHDGDTRTLLVLSDAVPALVVTLLIIAARRGRISATNAGWFVVVGSVAVSTGALVTAVLSAEPPFFAYLIIMTMVNSTSALDSRQFLAAQVIPVGGTAIALLANPAAPNAGNWLVVVGVAFAASIIVHSARARATREIARLMTLLEYEAIQDPLTGLGTRRAFDRLAHGVAEEAAVADLDIFVIFLDVDGLGSVNDAHGHAAGDEVLVAVAQAMRESARSKDVLVRWGGDEFAVLGMGDAQAPVRWATSVRQRVASLRVADGAWTGTVSVGHAAGPVARRSPHDLVIRADAAMYEARVNRPVRTGLPVTESKG